MKSLKNFSSVDILVVFFLRGHFGVLNQELLDAGLAELYLE